MTEKNFRKVVGEPAEHVDNGDLVRFFESQRKLTPEDVARLHPGWQGVEAADITHSVWGRFKDGKLVAFGAYRVETL